MNEVTSQQPAAEIVSGVTIPWLSKAFGMDMATVRRKLADCPTIGTKTSGHRYALKVAAAYLVKPRVDIATYIEGIEPRDLPTKLQPSYWDAQNRRLRWEREAGRLWETDDVIEVLSEVFKRIKFSCQLWVDDLEEIETLSDAQRKALLAKVDGLQNTIYAAMIELAEERSTPAAIRRLEEVPEETESEEDDSDDDLMDLV